MQTNAGQLGPRQVGPYVKTTRTVLLFYNIFQYLYVYNYLFIYLKDNYRSVRRSH